MTDSGPPLVVYTVGHSVHPIDAFLDILRTHDIRQVADVRLLPQSRRHPQFGREALARALAGAGIAYQHFPGLGGMRRARPDSVNTAIRGAAYRGYADHMQSSEFEIAIQALDGFARLALTSVMCAEALWWECHRRFLSDALLVRGVIVRHIVPGQPPKAHELSEFAQVHGERVIYPGLL